MPFPFDQKEHFAFPQFLLKWGLLGAWTGILAGSASALFLYTLNKATAFRETHPPLLLMLPLAGIGISLLYARWGRKVESGNDLLLERIHDPKETVPFRMAPLILIATLLTHLFGGSAGREGTAVQMGGTLANLARGPLRLTAHEQRLLLMGGISGGFGSVFGTPLAGAVFGMEVLTLGRMSYEGLIPCFMAAIVGDVVCRGWGITHEVYPVGTLPPLTPHLWLLIALAGGLFAGAGVLFIELTHAIGRVVKARIRQAWLRPVLGGLLIIALTFALGTRNYLGLGLPLIAQSFTPGGVFAGAFALKILFTAITLGTGFKGGEVTPLFCIGATLGAAFAHFTGQPTAFFAALGFAAVFAGAANTPLSCILLGIELFGGQCALPLAAACFLSYLLSGHRGIYVSQRVGTSKSHVVALPENATLHELAHSAVHDKPPH